MPCAFLYPMLITQLIDAGQLNKVKINKNGSCIPVNNSCRDGDHIFYKLEMSCMLVEALC